MMYCHTCNSHDHDEVSAKKVEITHAKKNLVTKIQSLWSSMSCRCQNISGYKYHQ